VSGEWSSAPARHVPAMSFLDLPIEIRLNIYTLAFGHGKVVLHPQNQDESSSLVPATATLQGAVQRSSQLLRTCRTILFEARPLLYSHTTFHVVVQTFAGRLPATIIGGHPCAPLMRHLIWQLDCDMLRRFNPEDVRIGPFDVAQLASFELRVRAQAWRNLFLGDGCDREAFLLGREQIFSYTQVLQQLMGADGTWPLSLVEDRAQFERGRVILKVQRSPRSKREVRSSGASTHEIYS